MRGRELPQRRARQHRGFYSQSLTARIQNASIELVQRVRQPCKVGWFWTRKDVDVDRRPYVPVGLHRKAADDHVIDSMLGQHA